jgi:hypothetical protein
MSSRAEDRIFARATECAFREIDGEAFIVSPKTGEAHLLNPTGSFIWSKLDGVATAGRIAAELAAEFDVGAETALADTGEFLDELERLELALDIGKEFNEGSN